MGLKKSQRKYCLDHYQTAPVTGKPRHCDKRSFITTCAQGFEKKCYVSSFFQLYNFGIIKNPICIM
jgi:hypothetical protein